MRETDAELAARLAGEAGQTLLALRAGHAGDERTLRDAGDQAAQRRLAEALAAARPGDAVLSEEAPDHAARLTAERVWIVDPLDGTREFAEGRSDWAVHVALWCGGELIAAAVALPGLGTVLRSDLPPETSQRPARPPRIAVSRTRPPAVAAHVAEALGGELVPMGSAGYKIGAVIRGEADAYVHAGGQYEWDSAAPAGVALAAGLHASRLDGSPLKYNQPDPYLPDLLIARPDLADAALTACAGFTADLVSPAPRPAP